MSFQHLTVHFRLLSQILCVFEDEEETWNIDVSEIRNIQYLPIIQGEKHMTSCMCYEYNNYSEF